MSKTKVLLIVFLIVAAAELNWPVLCFTFSLAVAAGVLFGLAPAIQSTKIDFTPALKQNTGYGGNGKPGGMADSRLGLVTAAAVCVLCMCLS
jgi:hypothetical protein